MKEYIICSAIYLNDNIKHQDQPQNIETGYVISGRRHNNCFATLVAILGREPADLKEYECGFITSLNNYLNREEAFIMAISANQLLYPKLYGNQDKNILTSECIFPTDWEDFKY